MQHIKGTVTVRPGKKREATGGLGSILNLFDGLVIDLDLNIDDDGLEMFK